MDAATGNFEFYTTELDVAGTAGGFMPGDYILTLTAISGTLSIDTTFTLTLIDPCPTVATLSINQILVDPPYVHRLRDTAVPYAWDPTIVATT